MWFILLGSHGRNKQKLFSVGKTNLPFTFGRKVSSIFRCFGGVVFVLFVFLKIRKYLKNLNNVAVSYVHHDCGLAGFYKHMFLT